MSTPRFLFGNGLHLYSWMILVAATISDADILLQSPPDTLAAPAIVYPIGTIFNVTWTSTSDIVPQFSISLYQWFDLASSNFVNLGSPYYVVSTQVQCCTVDSTSWVYSWNTTGAPPGAFTLVVASNTSSAPSTFVYDFGYVMMAEANPVIGRSNGSFAIFIKSWLPVLNGMIEISTPSDTFKSSITDVLSGVTPQTADTWYVGEEHSLIWSQHPSIDTARVDIFHARDIFSQIRLGLSIMDAMNVTTPTAVLQDLINKASGNATSLSLRFTVPSTALAGYNSYLLAIRATDGTPACALAFIRVRVSAPCVTGDACALLAGATFTGAVGSPFDFAGNTYTCLSSSVFSQANLTFGQMDPAGAVELFLTVGKVVNFTCFVQSYDYTTLQCVPDDFSTYRDVALCLYAKLGPTYQAIFVGIYSNLNQAACSVLPAKNTCTKTNATFSILTPRAFAGSFLSATFNATATLFLPAGAALGGAVPTPPPPPTSPSSGKLSGGQVFGVLVCVGFGVYWFLAGWYSFYQKFFARGALFGDRPGSVVLPR